MIQIAATLTSVTNTERHKDLAFQFRKAARDMAVDDVRKLCDVAALLRTRLDPKTELHVAAVETLITHGTDDIKGMLLLNIAESVAHMSEMAQFGFLDAVPVAAQNNPYETVQALRLFIEASGANDTEAVRYAQTLLKAQEDMPGLVFEILVREHGVSRDELPSAPGPFIHPEPTKYRM